MEINRAFVALQPLLFVLVVKRCESDQVLYHCTFETNEDCRLEQDPSDEFDWEVHRGVAPSSHAKVHHRRGRHHRSIRKRGSFGYEEYPGPLSVLRELSYEERELMNYNIFIDLAQGPFPTRPFVDHTYGNDSGHFAHLVAKDSTRTSGHARIMSPPITVPDSVEADLTFFYHLWDAKERPSASQLKIFACEEKDLVFTATASLGSVWMKAEVRIQCNGTFRIIFEGFIGGTDVDIAIDDVNVTVSNGTPATEQPDSTWNWDDDSNATTTILPATTLSTSPGDPGPGPEGPDTGLDPETAVSLVVIALVLFAATCFMLLVTLMIHIRFRSKRRRRGRSHEPLSFGSEFFNRHSMDPSEATAYMTLNFPPSSTSGSGIELLSMSERHSHDSKRSKPSSGMQSKRSSGLNASAESIRRSVYTRRSTVGQRRQSRTFPATKELKNILESVRMRRFRTLSQHLSVADVENLRRTLCSQGETTFNSDRTVSTVLLDASASTLRPMSDMSDHFYYSLFPTVGIVSCKNSLVACEEAGPIVELDDSSRPCSGDYDSDDLEVQAVTSGSLLNKSMSRSDTGSDASVAPETTQMVDNEIYECYTNSDSSSPDTAQ
ncbi:uncharacterized protein LOC119727313 [Patiria miniata]|uniref:MAM domain-containing protein n=1 Tax=Patiria miniata TaxID=46514 RepID=A0A913ZV01_PATMI|nr:uncharacterized protein LOC119727313 [Patiria miniata]